MSIVGRIALSLFLILGAGEILYSMTLTYERGLMNLIAGSIILAISVVGFCFDFLDQYLKRQRKDALYHNIIAGGLTEDVDQEKFEANLFTRLLEAAIDEPGAYRGFLERLPSLTCEKFIGFVETASTERRAAESEKIRKAHQPNTAGSDKAFSALSRELEPFRVLVDLAKGILKKDLERRTFNDLRSFAPKAN